MIKKTSSRKISKSVPKFSLLLAFLMLLIFFFVPGQNIYQTTTKEGRPQVAGFSTIMPTPAPYPVNVTGLLPPELTAQAIIVSDIPSGVTLYKKNPTLRLSPASITKLMTAMVGLEKFKMDDILTVKTVISEGRTMGLATGEKLTFENLLYATLVHSANDAAYVIAENYPGGTEEFVTRMNKRAGELYLRQTHFTNPIGFEDVNHFTTASDLACLANIALNNQVLAKIVATPAITISDTSFTRFYNLQNVNQLLGKIPGVLGVKTGWTENAGECLVTAVSKNERKILLVVLGSQDRFGETKTLIDWVFANFTWQTLALPKQG